MHSLSGLIFPKFVNGLADPELFLRRQLKVVVRWVHGAIAKRKSETIDFNQLVRPQDVRKLPAVRLSKLV